MAIIQLHFSTITPAIFIVECGIFTATRPHIVDPLACIWCTGISEWIAILQFRFSRLIGNNFIETFKILSDFKNASSHQFFQLQSRGYCTRGHSMKQQVQRSRLDTSKYCHSQRVVNHWNGLPQSLLQATSITIQEAAWYMYKIWA